MRTAALQRINALWFMTLGVTALAAGILVYLLLLESALGAFSIRDAGPGLLSDTERGRVLLYESPASRDRYGSLYGEEAGQALYDSTLSSWRAILNRRLSGRNDVSSLRKSELEAMLPGMDDVLVLPATISLDQGERLEIRRFLERGGCVLVSWGAGLYDEDGGWRGWEFMESTFGFQFKSFVGPGPEQFLVRSDTVSGDAIPGVYVAGTRFDELRSRRAARRTARENAAYRDRMDAAEQVSVAPLSGYVWFDTLGAAHPDFDHVVVSRPDTDSSSDSAQAWIVLTYYTWLGEASAPEVPYPRTDSHTRRFTLRANTPATAGIPGGYRAKIQVYSPGVNMRVTAPERVASAGFWYDFATDAPIQTDVLHPQTGLLYGSYGTGRFVVMGFGPDALGASSGDPEDERVLGRLYDNIIAYLRREPTIWTHDWPSGFDAAVLMSPGVDSIATGVPEMMDFFIQENLPATFFVDERAARSLPAQMRQFGERGEVGLLDPARRTGSTPETERDRIARAKERVEKASGREVRGFRALRPGALSSATLSALTAEDFTYFLPDSVGRRTTPKIMGAPNARLTRLGVTGLDLLSDPIPDSAAAREALASISLSEAYRIISEGGLVRLSLPSTLFSGSAGRGFIRNLTDRLRRENVWFATGSEIADWWRLRRGLNADVEQRSPSRIFVRVSNDNGDTAEHATVSISLGHPVSSVRIKPELINILRKTDDEIAVPPHRLSEDGTVLELSIRQLKPQQYRIFHIDLFGVTPAGQVTEDKSRETE